MKKITLLCALLCGFATAQAKVTLPTVIASNAVLQQNESVKLWGEGTPNSKLTIRPSWTKQKYTTQIAADGKWELPVETVAAGGPYTISFDDGEVTKIDNIMLGEVWLCFGQSNMRMAIYGNGGQPVEGLMDVLLQADSLIPIRYFRAELQSAFEPKDDLEGNWKVNSPKSVKTLGATAYFFAQYLQSVLKVPVGVVECAWGGSKIEAWMSPDMLNEYKAGYPMPKSSKDFVNGKANNTAAQLYNGLLSPLKNLRFKGALWYQGESNLLNSDEYPALFKIFVESLREDHFDNGVFPFYYAQIAPYGLNAASGKNYNIRMRETQAKMIDNVERVGMVVLSDIGEEVCIHPRQKKSVGNRFAYWALGDTYGYDMVDYRAPEFNTMRQLAANNKYPKRVGLNFKHAPLGLCFADANVPSVNFEVAGEDKVFYPATARISNGNNHIEVWSDQVEDIVAVRYGCREYFKGDVFNSYGIPISSFRTDDWDL
ncbi:MAG: sialate O-acetylesterase [Rikenellaceae bacterium]